MHRFLLLLLFLWGGLSAQAHPIFQNNLWVEYTETEMAANVQVTVKEICTAAGLPFNIDTPADRALIEDAAPKHLDYLLSHLHISANSQELKGSLVSVDPPIAWIPTPADLNAIAPNTPIPKNEVTDRLHFFFKLKYPLTSPPYRVTISHEMMQEFSYAPGTPFNFSYHVRVPRKGKPATEFGTLAVGSTFDVATEFTPPASAAADLPEKRTHWTRAKEFIHEGVMHVLKGYDHLLFAAALVLALRGFWEVFRIIGIFTIAHSITVTLTCYQLVRVPSSIVEPLIAASIVIVALENVFFPSKARGKRRVAWTFFFGLVHGLGLAGALVENLHGFTVGMIALAVIAFCVGVEIGHLCIVAPLSVLMSGGRSVGGETFSKNAMRYGSILIAIGGIYYFLNAIQVMPESLSPETLFGGG